MHYFLFSQKCSSEFDIINELSDDESKKILQLDTPEASDVEDTILAEQLKEPEREDDDESEKA